MLSCPRPQSQLYQIQRTSLIRVSAVREYETPVAVANNLSVFYVAFKTAMVGKIRVTGPVRQPYSPSGAIRQAGLPKHRSVMVEERVLAFLIQLFLS